ncbi:hypothetical protein GCM10010260_66460 [Streptomyces filipinensis]|uniref:Uncharacterized protein n=1 Tax=Streptomyces filipinensis TaxID=66887 RepID=A0A918IHC3_9ACTN|nr:hypothetical protein GCM10010260_66460 [Streptomyces filipinensis]
MCCPPGRVIALLARSRAGCCWAPGAGGYGADRSVPLTLSVTCLMVRLACIREKGVVSLTDELLLSVR